jgi:hypothetical protein
MAKSSLPSIEDRCVCIVTQAALALAATISSYFDERGTYFAVFEFPTRDYPYRSSKVGQCSRIYRHGYTEDATTTTDSSTSTVRGHQVH